eukprot:1018904-Rhodomonas_salina.2
MILTLAIGPCLPNSFIRISSDTCNDTARRCSVSSSKRNAGRSETWFLKHPGLLVQTHPDWISARCSGYVCKRQLGASRVKEDNTQQPRTSSNQRERKAGLRFVLPVDAGSRRTDWSSRGHRRRRSLPPRGRAPTRVRCRTWTGALQIFSGSRVSFSNVRHTRKRPSRVDLCWKRSVAFERADVLPHAAVSFRSFRRVPSRRAPRFAADPADWLFLNSWERYRAVSAPIFAQPRHEGAGSQHRL